MKTLMIKAHRMTRKIVEKYGDVDYKVQFGLCLQAVIEDHQKAVERILNKVKDSTISKKQANYAYACCKNNNFRLDRELINFMYSMVDFEADTEAEEKMALIFRQGMELIFNGLMRDSVKYLNRAYKMYAK